MKMKKDFVHEVFAIVDAMDADRFAELFTEDGSLYFSNNPVVTGKVEIRSTIAYVFTTFKDIDHTIEMSWQEGDYTICRMSITYKKMDDTHVTLPCVTIFKQRDQLIDEYQIYMDISPVYA